MVVKRTGCLVEAFLGDKQAGGSSPLDRLSGLVSQRDGGLGRAAWPRLVLFKALLLQSLYGLSDRELEESGPRQQIVDLAL